MPDTPARTWSPDVIRKVVLAFADVSEASASFIASWETDARRALDASPLGDAVDLLDRLANWRASDLTETVAEARAFLARVREGK